MVTSVGGMDPSSFVFPPLGFALAAKTDEFKLGSIDGVFVDTLVGNSDRRAAN